MEETPMLDLSSIDEVYGLEEKLSTQKIMVSDKSDSFVIDMESFNHAVSDKDVTANSRISLQRNLSRKGSQRVGEKEISTNGNSNERDVSSSAVTSPTGPITPKKPTVVLGTADHPGSPQVHHQITVTAANIGTATDGKCVVRRNNFRRSSSWTVDPKRVLFFFATLSSIGTMLLIYLTLAIGKYNPEENSLDW